MDFFNEVDRIRDTRNERKEHPKTTQEKEQLLFSRLDILGDRAVAVFTKLVDRYVKIKIDVEEMDFSDLKLTESDLVDLTESQKELLKIFSQELVEDSEKLHTYIEKTSHDKIYKDIYSLIKPNKKGFIDEKFARFQEVPGGVVLFVNDEKYFASLFPNADDALGLYVYEQDNQTANPINGRLLVVQQVETLKGDPTPEDALAHEYWHMLVSRYGNRLEIPPVISKECSRLQKKKSRLMENLKYLEEQLEYADHKEYSHLHNAIVKIHVEMKKIEENMVAEVDKSDYFLTEQAKDIFSVMRDELAAHAIVGIVIATSQPLMKAGITFEQALTKISHVKDRDKLLHQWKELQQTLKELKEGSQSIDTYRLTSIFLSSQNLIQMARRIKKHSAVVNQYYKNSLALD